ncbi:hypothetical protein AYO20_04182 [Fonsecaea nubica]|uniref:Argonaute linker 1 domain-containing protein n=1 Tax=Fonsecaea nubica TaxID=856822 RepID=A0A178D495_9EURO|nr:hypothetical protein AYO20_04182 [Fonsecaea nubica]OAL36566.1 hypothetical protein AYO20_04182 [Fonsecaea nubica]
MVVVADLTVVALKEASPVPQLSSRMDFLPERGASSRCLELTFSSLYSHGPGDVAILDVKNRDLENEIEKTVLKPSASDPRLPVRPGFGTQGYRILLYANYMHLDWGNVTFYRYALDFAVQGTPGRQIKKKDKQRLVTLLIEENFAQNRSGIVTDFTSLIISNTQLNQQSYDVVYRREGEDTPVATARRYRIRLVPDGANTASELLTYLTSTNPNEVCPSKDRTIQALNIVMGHNPRSSSRVASIGSNKHYPKWPLEADRASLGAGLTVIRGFFVSVRPATGRILVNVQVKCSPFYNHGPLVNLIQDFRASRDPKKQELHRFLKRLTVHTTHTSPRKDGQPIPLPRVICGLATKKDGKSLPHPPRVLEFGAGAQQIQFWLDREGKYITVFDFFRQTYTKEISKQSPALSNISHYASRKQQDSKNRTAVVLGESMRCRPYLNNLMSQEDIFIIQTTLTDAWSCLCKTTREAGLRVLRSTSIHSQSNNSHGRLVLSL